MEDVYPYPQPRPQFLYEVRINQVLLPFHRGIRQGAPSTYLKTKPNK